MIAIKGLLNRPAAFDARDAVAPPGFVPYDETAAAQRKDFETTRAEFARLGHELKTRQFVASGQTLFDVSRHGQTRTFSHWGDVKALLSVLKGVAHG
jgi:hypothetical protein